MAKNDAAPDSVRHPRQIRYRFGTEAERRSGRFGRGANNRQEADSEITFKDGGGALTKPSEVESDLAGTDPGHSVSENSPQATRGIGVSPASPEVAIDILEQRETIRETGATSARGPAGPNGSRGKQTDRWQPPRLFPAGGIRASPSSRPFRDPAKAQSPFFSSLSV